MINWVRSLQKNSTAAAEIQLVITEEGDLATMDDPNRAYWEAQRQQGVTKFLG